MFRFDFHANSLRLTPRTIAHLPQPGNGHRNGLRALLRLTPACHTPVDAKSVPALEKKFCNVCCSFSIYASHRIAARTVVPDVSSSFSTSFSMSSVVFLSPLVAFSSSCATCV